MKELEKAIDQLKKENDRIEKVQNRAKLLNQKINKLKRNAETKRKVQKGGVFEAFEREITGRQEDTNNDLIYDFLDYVLSDNRNREKLKELTEIHLREKEISLELRWSEVRNILTLCFFVDLKIYKKQSSQGSKGE